MMLGLSGRDEERVVSIHDVTSDGVVMMMFGVRSGGRTDDTQWCEGQTAEQFPAKQPR
jgi:hypothetical protein